MSFLQRLVPTTDQLTRLSRICLVAFLAFAVVWKGGKSLESTWLLVALAWLCSVQFWWVDRRSVPTLPFWMWLTGIGFIFWVAVSYLLTSTANYGLDELFRSASLVLIFFWVARTVAAEGEMRGSLLKTIKSILAWVTLVACFAGVLIYVFQPVGRLVGTFLDPRFHTDYWPNAFAEFLLLTWPIVYLWAPQKVEQLQPYLRPHYREYLWQILVGFVFGCLFLTYSRGALLAFVGQLLLWGMLLWRSGWRKEQFFNLKKQMAMIGIVALVVFAGVNAYRSALYEVESVQEKVTFTASEGKSSVSERQQFWRQAAALTFQNPVFGWGPYSFRFVQPRLQHDVLATSDHPHNVFLKIAVESGVPAMLLYLSLIGGVLWIQLRRTLREPAAPSHFEEYPVLIGVTGVLAHNMIDYNLQFVGIALPFFVLLGLLAAPFLGGDTSAHSYSLRRLAELATACTLLVVAIFEGQFLMLSSLGRHAEAAGDIERALVWYNRSSVERFSRDLHLSRAYLSLEQKNYQAARAALEVYFTQNDQDARAYKLHGDVCRAQRDIECALASYEQAYLLDHFNDLSITRAYVDTLRDMDDLETINERRAEFESLMNDFQLAILMNTHYIALSRNVEELVALADTFAEIYPSEEPLYIVMAARAARQADIERRRLAARAPGYLW